MKYLNKKPWAALAALSATLATVGTSHAALDISDATDAITEAQTHIATLGGAALTIAGLFLGYKLVRRAINKV